MQRAHPAALSEPLSPFVIWHDAESAVLMR
jgi:hypothetical protein